MPHGNSQSLLNIDNCFAVYNILKQKTVDME